MKLPAVDSDMDFVALATECAPWVAPQTLAAIVKTESQFKPLAININGGAKLERQPLTKEEAVATAKWLLANNYNIDLGLGQVNSFNLAKVNLSVEDAFDPCKNLAASASILQSNYESASKRIPGEQAALQAAISAYNTGSFTRGFSNGYVQKVMSNAKVTLAPVDNLKSAIDPIPLVNIGKRSLIKYSATTMVDASPIRTSSKVTGAPEQLLSSDVYTEDKLEKSIMVYR